MTFEYRFQPSQWGILGGKPYVLVTPNGPTDGGDFGPNTFGTVTAGIQEAIDSLGSGGGAVYIAQGTYNLTNVPANSGNCLISIPSFSDENTNAVAFAIIGMVPPALPMVENAAYTTPPNLGSCVVLNVINPAPVISSPQNNPPAIIACSQPPTGVFNPVVLTVENIEFLQPNPATYCDINGHWFVGTEYRNILAMPNVGWANITEPSSVGAIGLIGNQNGGQTMVVSNVMIVGHYGGIMFGSHVEGDEIIVIGNVVAFPGSSNYWGNLGHVDAEFCPHYFGNSVYPLVNSNAVLTITNLAIAQYNPPAWMSIVDAFYSSSAANTDYLIHVLNLTSNWTGSSVTSITQLLVNSPRVIIDKALNDLSGFSYPQTAVPASGTAFKNNGPYAIDIFILTAGVTTGFTVADKNGTPYAFTNTVTEGFLYRLLPFESITLVYTTAPTWIFKANA